MLQQRDGISQCCQAFKVVAVCNNTLTSTVAGSISAVTLLSKHWHSLRATNSLFVQLNNWI
jgi:hypothetical protein